MIEGRPSRTAQHNALFRALEQRQPAPLFADPFARRFLRGRYRLYGALPARAVARFIDGRWPGPRAAVCVRTRYIDDRVADALAAGLDQLVILGAGFDARAHRLAGLARVRVFEVDHPSTQSMKRTVVGTAPAHVRYVAADLAREPLGEVLEAAGVARGARTLVLWEGVTNYLDGSSVDATLRTVGGLASSVVFTYVERALIDASAAFRGGTESLAYVRGLGEPFTFGLDPAEVPAYLAERGLGLLEDLDLETVAARYYPGARPPVSAFYHVVTARCRA
ncbi:MAG: SAM-dependent methyltransferase [Vicinamibacteria bacterium]